MLRRMYPSVFTTVGLTGCIVSASSGKGSRWLSKRYPSIMGRRIDKIVKAPDGMWG